MSLRCQKVQIMHSLMQCPLKPNADEKKFDTKLLLNPWKEVELFTNPFPFAQWSISTGLYQKQHMASKLSEINKTPYNGVFFFFSPSMNLQGDPSLSDPSISQSLTFPGSSWCGRVLRSPTSTQRNVLLPSENKTMEGLRHKSQIGRRSFRGGAAWLGFKG